MTRKTSFRLAGIVAIIVNAVLQAILIIPSPILGQDDISYYALVIVSALVYFAFLVVVVAIKTAPPNIRTVADSLTDFRPRLGRFARWLVGFSIVVVIGFLLWLIPGFLVLAVAPMVVLAAADRQPRPVEANFRAIKSHFWGYVWRILVSAALCFLAYLISALAMFLEVGAPGAFFGWVVIGGCIWVLTNLWLRFLRRATQWHEPLNNVAESDSDNEVRENSNSR